MFFGSFSTEKKVKSFLLKIGRTGGGGVDAQRLFRRLDFEEQGFITSAQFVIGLEKMGLNLNDMVVVLVQ